MAKTVTQYREDNNSWRIHGNMYTRQRQQTRKEFAIRRTENSNEPLVADTQTILQINIYPGFENRGNNGITYAEFQEVLVPKWPLLSGNLSFLCVFLDLFRFLSIRIDLEIHMEVFCNRIYL